MKIRLLNSENIEFKNLDDLNKVIPKKLSGQAENHGQGEGQVEILNTVWGFYVGNDNNYYMQYEEGVESWEFIQTLVTSIALQISQEFNTDIILELEGPYTNNPDV